MNYPHSISQLFEFKKSLLIEYKYFSFETLGAKNIAQPKLSGDFACPETSSPIHSTLAMSSWSWNIGLKRKVFKQREKLLPGAKSVSSLFVL